MRTDFELDDTGDLKIVNGDFVVSPSDTQNVNLIFKTFKGEWKEHPLVGFGATKYIKKTTELSVNKFKRELNIQLEYDGYINPDIDLSEGIREVKIEV